MTLLWEWLARSYFRSGLEQTALRIYESIMSEKRNSFNQNRIELLRFMHSVDSEIGIPDKWVLAQEIPGKRNGAQIFQDPVHSRRLQMEDFLPPLLLMKL